MGKTLRLNLFGHFEGKWSDGKALETLPKKAQALMAYLCVEHDRGHTRDQLATLLWSETGEERARHNLRQALSKLRRCCGSVIESHGDLLKINLGSCSVDVVDFERLAESDEADDLQRCLDLYRGEILEGLISREAVYEEWLLVVRRRFQHLTCETADRLSSRLVDENRIDEAIEALKRRLAMDPACEPAHLALMKLLARAGRRSDALRQFQSCVEALSRELGAEPGPETKAFRSSLQVEAPEVQAGGGLASDTPSSPSKLDRPKVAVLPFENISSTEDAYFTDGMVEDLITSLSCFHSLFVISRGSSFALRDRDLSEKEIANELGVQFLVRGSVQRCGRRVRINIQLLDALAGLQLWGHRFDRELEDVFSLQDEITSTVASTLVGQVEAARLAHARRAPAERLEAYDFVLRGKDYHHRYTAKDCQTCLDMFERAIERDPDYAVAHAWLACGLGQAMSFWPDERDTFVDRAQAAAERGLELDENESECHRILAQVFLIKQDLKRSFWHQERALFLNPNDDRSVCAMGEILAFLGRAREAEEWIRKAMRLNPYHPPRYWTHLGRALFHLERFEEAVQALEQVRRPRLDNLVYRLASSSRLGATVEVERCMAELRTSFPEGELISFARAFPYESDSDRKALLDPLSRVVRKL